MKTFKKFAALLVAMMMVLAMAVPAMAETTYDYPLTVTNLANGDTVKFYKVIEWVGETTGNVAGWKAVSGYESVLTSDVLTTMLVGDPDAEPSVAPTGMTSAIAGKLAALASGGENATSYSTDGKTATYNNASSGMYMALVTPTDANTVYNPVFVSADYNKETGHTGTVAVDGAYADGVAKSSTVTVEKDGEDKVSVDTDKKGTVAVGDTLDFTVTTTIPGYGDVYEHPKFEVADTLTGLKLVGGTIEVKAGSTTLQLGSDKDYTIDPAAYADGTTYTVKFTEKYLKSLKAATSVTITYDGIVTVTPENAINQTDNEVTITYSHNPNDQSDYDVKKDTTQHYTFSLDAEGLGAGADTTLHGKKTSELVKIGQDAFGNPINEKTEHSEITGSTTETWEGPLEGATFGLFTDSAATTPLKDKDNNNVEATTGADGRMNFAGLDAGTYYLKELSAPDGFVTNSTVHTIIITAQTEEVDVTETVAGKEVTYKTNVLKSYTVTVDGNETATYTFKNDKVNGNSNNDIVWDEADIVEKPSKLPNTKGTELPSTGGMGTTILYTVGGIMVLGAVVVMITRRRVRG